MVFAMLVLSCARSKYSDKIFFSLSLLGVSIWKIEKLNIFFSHSSQVIMIRCIFLTFWVTLLATRMGSVQVKLHKKNFFSVFLHNSDYHCFFFFFPFLFILKKKGPQNPWIRFFNFFSKSWIIWSPCCSIVWRHKQTTTERSPRCKMCV